MVLICEERHKVGGKFPPVMKGMINMKMSGLLFDVIEDVKFYRNVNDTDMLYAEFQNINADTVFAHIESKEFKSYLLGKSLEFEETYNEILDPNAAIQTLQLLLNYYKSCDDTEVFVRTSGNLKDYIEYDLQDESQHSIIVTSGGWKKSPKKRKFTVSKASLPQVEPKTTTKSPLELLQKFVNVYNDSYILLVIWIVQAFIRGSHYILWLFADKGSGKSTISKIIKKIIDPCKFTVTTIPEKKDDLRVLLNSTHLCCFDNISSISPDVSDLFCGAVTGTAVVKRSLYTNKDIDVCTLNNTLVLNGIGYRIDRDDLAERTIIMQLEKLPPTTLKSEKGLWAKFEEALPEILGSIFNTLSKALTEIENVKKENLPRMTDAFIEMMAIARALGISEEKFREIYANNLVELEAARAGSPVVTAVKEYMANVSERKIEMFSTEFYKSVYENFSGEKSLLPGSAAHFSKSLDREFLNILKIGYRVNIDDTGAKGTMISVIRKNKKPSPDV